ncbi:MAG: glucose-6-phosphate isomerase [Puniceicoccaceae bacterium]
MSWNSFTENVYINAGLDFTLDYSLMGADASFFEKMEPRMQAAFSAMQELEGGAIANPDEGRMVGHYWLRNPGLAPEPALAESIEANVAAIEAFAAQIHRGEITGAGGAFEHLLVIGIGGSALGPQFVAQALGQPGEDRLQLHFFDNTDPDGLDLALANLRGQLDKTLAVVISKSGGTPETRNGMLEAMQAYLAEGIEFASQAVAITGDGSNLDKVASEDGWLARFPMWDWVGGRTSELAGVGLFPAALQGLDIRGMLKGAADMDALTRIPVTRENPAALLALLWFHATNGKGEKDMVILPYKDRLMLFSKYLQQLIMESLGKEKDLDGNVVYQGIAVYGNKGSTDQHAYVQQLREGVNNFFATFIEVKKDREGASIEVEDGITSGDYLHAFLLGTRSALAEMDRASLTLTIDEVNARTVGMLIALYERAVGFYASLVNINAYHQPGVEAGKKAAASFLKLQQRLIAHLEANRGSFQSVPEIAAALNAADEAVTIYKLLEHALLNPSKGIQKKLSEKPFDSTYGVV